MWKDMQMQIGDGDDDDMGDEGSERWREFNSQCRIGSRGEDLLVACCYCWEKVVKLKGQYIVYVLRLVCEGNLGCCDRDWLI
jgi:hypothetical protein